jgi:hypothetical protein
MKEVFWINDVNMLFDTRYILEIWPGERTKSIESKCNAISRFIIIYAMMISVYKKKTIPLLIAIVLLLFVIVMYKKYKKPLEGHTIVNSKFHETHHNISQFSENNANNVHNNRFEDKCRDSTANNVFANPNTNVIGSVVIPSCETKSTAYDEGFSNFVNVENDDIFNQNSRRQFYSVVDNNQANFAKFLYEK